MNSIISTEEKALFELLKKAINKNDYVGKIGSEINSDIICFLAQKHSVLSLLYDELTDKEDISATDRKNLENNSHQTVTQSYRLLFLSKAIVDLFNDNGIEVLVLKGCCAAANYPVPELRKSGDVDLLIKPHNLDAACQLLIKNGFVLNEDQHVNHHIGFKNKEQIEVELHTMLTEPFDNEFINKYLQKLVGRLSELKVHKDVMGLSIPTLKDGFFVYQLLLHMLQHFLRSGFGLKLLCDWVVFWNNKTNAETKTDYLKLVNESGLKGFSDMITAVCVYFLGLKKESISFMFSDSSMPEKTKAEDFINEISEAGEFGKSTKDRMVVMRGTSLVDYVREFHHQMKLSFLKASRIVILWPILWIITLVRFLINNKKIRNISAMEIFKKAHSRSKLIEEMNLFKKNNSTN